MRYSLFFQRSLIFLLSIAVLGIPLNQLSDLIVLLLASVFIFTCCPVSSLRRWCWGISLVLGILTLKGFLPRLDIQEGHHLFIVNGKNQVLEQNLPPQVFHPFLHKFHHFYEPRSFPLSQAERFQGLGVPQELFGWSADSIWAPSLYSRVVHHIDFDHMTTFRLGPINQILFNYLPQNLGFPRQELPFFVMYEFPAEAVGSEVHWQGLTVWEEKGRFTIRDTHPLLGETTSEGVYKIQTPQTRLYGFSVGSLMSPKDVLKITLTPPVLFKFSERFRPFLTGMGVVLLLGLLLRRLNATLLLLSLASGAATLLTVAILRPHLLQGLAAHLGGGDGLIHESYGRSMAQDFLTGHFWRAFQGVEEVFYFMPGLRYFRMVEKIFFGETNFGYLFCLSFLPLAVYFFLQSILPKKWALGASFIFAFTPVFERFGCALYLYVQQTATGHAEPLGHLLFYLGLGLILTSLNHKKDPYVIYGFWANLCFAGAIFIRPNFSVGASVFLLLTAGWLISQKRLRDLALSSLGFLPFVLIPLHNWVYGHKWVVLTSAIGIKENLPTSPLTYLLFFQELLSGTLSGPAFQQVMHQLYGWNKGTDFYRLIPLGVTVYLAFHRSTEFWIRALAWTTLSLQGLLFFYVPTGRYAYMAWSLCLTLFIVAFQRHWPFWAPAADLKARRQKTVRALQAF